MHFENIKLADCWVPLATETDMKGLPSHAALVTTAWPCRYLGQFITPSLGEFTSSEGCYDLVLERVITGTLK